MSNLREACYDLQFTILIDIPGSTNATCRVLLGILSFVSSTKFCVLLARDIHIDQSFGKVNLIFPFPPTFPPCCISPVSVLLLLLHKDTIDPFSRGYESYILYVFSI